jgi:hypothetical protein
MMLNYPVLGPWCVTVPVIDNSEINVFFNSLSLSVCVQPVCVCFVCERAYVYYVYITVHI